jgi:hypothetical protein
VNTPEELRAEEHFNDSGRAKAEIEARTKKN